MESARKRIEILKEIEKMLKIATNAELEVTYRFLRGLIQ